MGYISPGMTHHGLIAECAGLTVCFGLQVPFCLSDSAEGQNSVSDSQSQAPILSAYV